MALRRSDNSPEVANWIARDPARTLRVVPTPKLPLWCESLPVLESARVTLREPRPADAAALLASVGPPDVQRYLPPGPAQLDDVRGFIRWACRERRAGRYITYAVVPQGSDAIGLFQLWPVEPSFETAEWGFALARSSWGTGLFIECAQLVVDFAVDTLGVKRLEARAAAANGRGNGALRKLGAVQEGVLRRCFRCGDEYLDHVMWSILAEEWRRRRAPATP